MKVDSWSLSDISTGVPTRVLPPPAPSASYVHKRGVLGRGKEGAEGGNIIESARGKEGVR